MGEAVRESQERKAVVEAELAVKSTALQQAQEQCALLLAGEAGRNATVAGGSEEGLREEGWRAAPTMSTAAAERDAHNVQMQLRKELTCKDARLRELECELASARAQAASSIKGNTARHESAEADSDPLKPDDDLALELADEISALKVSHAKQVCHSASLSSIPQPIAHHATHPPPHPARLPIPPRLVPSYPYPTSLHPSHPNPPCPFRNRSR